MPDLTTTSRDLLQQAAALLDTATTSLDSIRCTIDGRLATFENTGTEWRAHEQLPATSVRQLHAPAGAPYVMLEMRSLAGAQAKHVQVSHASDVHVLAGLLHVGRAPGAPLNELYGTGTCARFEADEPHAYTVLQDLHSIIIFHPKPAKTHV